MNKQICTLLRRVVGWSMGVLSLTGCIVLMPQEAFANPVSREQATAYAKSFFEKKSLLRGDKELKLVSAPSFNSKGLRSASSVEASSDAVLYYVFNYGDQDGFLMVAGDDELPMTLGYSDKGSFSDRNMPDNFSSFISSYQAAIRHYLADGNKQMTISQESLNSSVSPLLADILWNQSAPWDDKTPIYNSQHCPVGCVATATSQIMRYYKWPDRGVGSNTYTDVYRETHSANFDVAYDWDNMPGIIENGQTVSDRQKAALSTLCYHVGVAVKMNYATNASGAFGQDVVTALRKFFKYDKSVQILDRDMYSQRQWNAMIRKELTERRPVEYLGYGDGGGHAFVCDGYDSEGLFHINWGWAGMSNGYFDLNLLNPDALGIGGGSGGGFNRGQQIIVNFTPDREGNSVEAPTLVECRSFELKKIGGGGLHCIMSLTLGQADMLSTKVRSVIENVDNKKDRKIVDSNEYLSLYCNNMYEVQPTNVRVFLQSAENGLTLTPNAKYRVYGEAKSSDGNYYRLLRTYGIADEAYFTTDSDGHIANIEEPAKEEAKLTLLLEGANAKLQFAENSRINFKVKNEGNKEALALTSIKFYDVKSGYLIYQDQRNVAYAEGQTDDISIYIDRLPIDPGTHVRITAECKGETKESSYAETTIVEEAVVTTPDHIRTGYIISLDKSLLNNQFEYFINANDFINDDDYQINGFTLKDVGSEFVKNVKYCAASLIIYDPEKGVPIGQTLIALTTIKDNWKGSEVTIDLPVIKDAKDDLLQFINGHNKYNYPVKLVVGVYNEAAAPLPVLRSDMPYVTFRDNGTTAVCQVENEHIQIYPNPVVSDLFIEHADCNAQVKVFDLNGKNILSSVTDNQGNGHIDMSRYPSGEYVVVIGVKSVHLLKR